MDKKVRNMEDGVKKTKGKHEARTPIVCSLSGLGKTVTCAETKEQLATEDERMIMMKMIMRTH